MTDAATDAEADALAKDAHEIVERLKSIDEKQKRNGALTVALLVQGLINVGIGALLAVLLVPVFTTANIVKEVAGPDAQASQATQTQTFVALFLCSARENTSESRVMDGKPPLPLREGCPPYDFSPTAPLLPQLTTTTTSRRARTPAARPGSTSTSASVVTPTTTSVTVTTRSQGCPVPTVPYLGTCLTVPRGLTP